MPLRFKFSILVLMTVWFWPVFVLAEVVPAIGVPAEFGGALKIFSVAGELKSSFDLPAYGDNGAEFALSRSYGTAGTKVLVCRGSGALSSVEVYDLTGALLEKFSPYRQQFRGGCFISATDLNGDGQDEIITGAGASGGPQIGIFGSSIKARYFWGFASNLRYGVRVLTGDLGKDGRSEIISISNYNQAPEIVLFGNDFHKINSWKIIDLKNTGLSVALGDFNGDGQKELAVAGGYGNAPKIRIYDLYFTLLKEIDYHHPDFSGGLNLAAGDLNNDGRSEIIVAEAFNGSGEVSIYGYDSGLIRSFAAYPSGFNQGVKVQIFDLDNDSKPEIITLPARFQANLKSDDYKFIAVDLKQQRLYRYQDGQLLDSFLVSSGKRNTPTLAGEFAIFNKRSKVRMTGIDYDLPNVPWVASYDGAYTIHGTYWHNNFGHPMSHGCVNMKTSEAKIVYDWSEIGTPVIIY